MNELMPAPLSGEIVHGGRPAGAASNGDRGFGRDRSDADLIAMQREQLAQAQRTNRALEIEAERQRQKVRALEALLPGAPAPSGNQVAGYLQQIADLTTMVADWQGKYGRQCRELEQLRNKLAAQGLRINELLAEIEHRRKAFDHATKVIIDLTASHDELAKRLARHREDHSGDYKI